MLPIRALARLLQRRSISPIELTEAVLARIDDLEPDLHTYLNVSVERARAAAHEAEVAIRAGRYRGALHGVPVGLKDLFDTADIPTTAGSRLLKDRIPAEDATVTSRLQSAGAVLIGKHTMHEFAWAVPFLDDFFPPARNPWDVTRVPGGSSSGSAAAVAAGLCAGAIGSDSAGSIRGPAAWCGVVGLKPTYGLISRLGMFPLSPTLDHAGPIGRCVEDVAILLGAVAGHDAGDPASASTTAADYSIDIAPAIHGVRIGIPVTYIDAAPGLTGDVLSAFRRAIATLEDLGAEVRDIDIPSLRLAESSWQAILRAEALSIHGPGLRARRQEYGRGFLQRLSTGDSGVISDLAEAQQTRRALSRALQDAMTRVDVIATPTSVRTAPTFAEFADEAVSRPTNASRFTAIFNLTGQPSLSVPCGFDTLGLPIGLLLSGRPFEESLLLRLARAYELANDSARMPPSSQVHAGRAYGRSSTIATSTGVNT